MRRLLLATTNPGKLREIRELLAAAPVELVGLDALPPIPPPEETGDAFDANARLKAAYYSRHTPLLTVAEDSGLVIDALGGEPGVNSARFLGPSTTYAARFQEIFRRLAGPPAQGRTARFVCALAAARGGEILFQTTGTIEGTIAERAAGDAGFGYDPIFYYPPFRRTLAEVSEAEKLRVAHRGHAFRAFARWLSEGGAGGARSKIRIEDEGM